MSEPGVPQLPTRCCECGSEQLTLDADVRVSHTIGPIDAVLDVWLGCDECSETVWSGTATDLVSMATAARQRQRRPVVPVARP